MSSMRPTGVAILSFALAVALFPQLVRADDLPLNMRANAGVQTGGRTSMVDITINEWTSAEERQSFIDYMMEEGTLNLDSKLQETGEKGRMNLRGRMGINIRYAYQFEKDGGRTIVLASDRPLSAGQAIDQTAASKAHNITMAVIELDDSGKGAGTLVVGAELSFGKDGKLEVTTGGQDGVHLGNVMVLKSKKKK